jgi:hypothetical protein
MISLVANDVKHFSIYLLNIYTSFWEVPIQIIFQFIDWIMCYFSVKLFYFFIYF